MGAVVRGLGGAPQQRRVVIRSFVRANHKIRVPNVRCVNSKGDMVGVMATRDAMKLAQQDGLDLVEISPNADPPVCRIMDFGKFRYSESIKRKKAKKQSQSHTRVVKEIKFHANVGEHDYQTKVNHLRSFLAKGYKVKVTLTFRGRENAHRELGFNLINQVLKDCEDLGVVDMPPKMVGRSVVSMLGARSVKSVQPAGR